MLRLSDFMTADVAVLAPEDSLRDAVTMLSEHFITGAPVVTGDKVVGVISAMDIMDYASTAQAVPSGSQDSVEWPGDEGDDGHGVSGSFFTDRVDDAEPLLGDGEVHDLMEDHTVGEAMTRNLLMLPPDTEVHTAAAYMVEHGAHRILVVDDGRLEGLVTTTDFLRLIGDRRL
ncbi:hypothetical protein BH23GEM9_BH23GEM9_16700 [soil metagenome]